MKRKLIIASIGIGIILVGFFVSTLLSNKSKKQRPVLERPAPTAFVRLVKNGNVPLVISSTGRVEAEKRIEIYAEVQGVMRNRKKTFKPGDRYGKGEVLVAIENEDQRARVTAERSVLQSLLAGVLPDLRLDHPEEFPAWEQYVTEMNVKRNIPELPEVKHEQTKLFLTGRNVYSSYFNVKNMEAVLGKYTITAPFKGALSVANVDQGSLVRPGQLLGVFLGEGDHELEATFSPDELALLEIGNQVKMVSPAASADTIIGTVKRVNTVVDANSQTGQAFIQIKDQGVQEGRFLNVLVNAPAIENAFTIDREMLQGEDQVFCVNAGELQLRKVNVVFRNEDDIIFSGLPDGTQILARPVPNAHQGMRVGQVNQVD